MNIDKYLQKFYMGESGGQIPTNPPDLDNPEHPDPGNPEQPTPPILGATVNIYSNDGSTLLGTVRSEYYVGTFLYLQVFYNETYKCISSNFTGSPAGTGFDLTPYAGVADTPYATTPTYADGYSFGNSGTFTVYVVPFGATVYYSSEHGTVPPPAYSIEELTASELPELVQEGYGFLGWYYESTYETKAAIGDPVTENITLYAKWEEKTAFVNYAALVDALTASADAIREKTGGSEPIAFDIENRTGFADTIEDMPEETLLTTKTVTANGTYTPSSGYDGFSLVTVSIPTYNGTVT